MIMWLYRWQPLKCHQKVEMSETGREHTAFKRPLVSVYSFSSLRVHPMWYVYNYYFYYRSLRATITETLPCCEAVRIMITRWAVDILSVILAWCSRCQTITTASSRRSTSGTAYLPLNLLDDSPASTAAALPQRIRVSREENAAPMVWTCTA